VPIYGIVADELAMGLLVLPIGFSFSEPQPDRIVISWKY